MSAAQSLVGNFGLYLRTGTPFWLIRNFSKFQVMSPRRTGVQMSFCTSCTTKSAPSPPTSSTGKGSAPLRKEKTACSPAPLTSILLNISKLGS